MIFSTSLGKVQIPPSNKNNFSESPCKGEKNLSRASGQIVPEIKTSTLKAK